MTKNMFILIAMYLLVIQTAVIGFMRDDTRRFVLSGLNFLFIMLILVLHGYFKKKEESHSHEIWRSQSKTTTTAKISDHQELKETVVTTKTVQLVDEDEEIEEIEETNSTLESTIPEWWEDMIQRAKRIREEEEQASQEELSIQENLEEDNQESDTPTNKPRKVAVLISFLVSLLIGYLVYNYWLSFGGTEYLSFWVWQLLFAVWLSFVLFLVLKLILARSAKAFWYKLFFILMLLSSFVYTVYALYMNNDKWLYATTNSMLDSVLNGAISITDFFNTDDSWIVDSWEVVNIVFSTWEVLSWDLEYTDTTTESGSLVVISQDDWLEQYWITSWDNVSIMTAVKYLIDTNEVPFDNTTNTSFTNISKADPDYKYFKTAAREWMIWKSTNPDTNITCDTYIVMKWLVEWWDIWSYTDIKQAYRSEAIELDKLNDCSKWNLLIAINL